MVATTSAMSIHAQLIGYVISSSTTSWWSPAWISEREWAQASAAMAWSMVRSAESHVKPSPIDHQSTPSCRQTFSSPVCHLPDFRNWTTATGQPRPTPRITTPIAAVVLPLPGPVFTSTSDGARRSSSGRGSSVGMSSGSRSGIGYLLRWRWWCSGGAGGRSGTTTSASRWRMTSTVAR